MPIFGSSHSPIRIVVAEHVALVRLGVRALLTLEHDMVLVGDACDGESAIELVARLCPDVAILDFDMPNTRAGELLAEVNRVSPRTRPLFLTMHASTDAAVSNDGQPAEVTALSKQLGAQQLVDAIRRLAHNGESDAEPRSFRVDGQNGARPPGLIASLSKREREVFDLVVHGMSNEELSKRLFVSIKTIETHRANINRKLSLHSTAGLVRFAARNGMLSMS